MSAGRLKNSSNPSTNSPQCLSFKNLKNLFARNLFGFLSFSNRFSQCEILKHFCKDLVQQLAIFLQRFNQRFFQCLLELTIVEMRLRHHSSPNNSIPLTYSS